MKLSSRLAEVIKNSSFMSGLFFLTTMIFCINARSIAQTVVTIGGGASITCPATPTATWTTPPTGVTFSNWSRGSGVTCGTASNGLSGSGFNTADASASYTANKYYSVTITADATHTFVLNQVVWSTAISSGGANFTVQYKNNGGSLTTLGSPAQTSTSSNTFSGSVTVAAGTSIILYLIPAGTGATGTTVRWVNGSTITVTASTSGYSVTYNGNSNTGGTAPTDATSYASGATVTVLGNTGSLTRTGYTFSNWNTASNGSGTDYSAGNSFTISANTTLYAKWSVNSYSVIYDGNSNTGGAAPGNQSGNYNTSISLSGAGTLARTGYTFSGWNTAANGSGTAYAAGASFTIPASNTTLYAQWTANTYSVAFDGNGNDGGTAPTSQSGNYNSNITSPGAGTLSRSGYAFTGWNTAADGSGTAYSVGSSFTIPASNTTLYAQWTAGTSYSVTYNGNGNTGGVVPADAASPYLSGSTVTVLGNTGSLVNTGYTFSGWNTQAGGGGTSYAPGNTFSIGANTILYAQWTINSYTITYNGNTNTGGSAPTTQAGNYNSTVSLSGAGTLVKTGYTFNGWNTQAGGGGTSYAAGASFTIPASNTTLYAQWSINNYTLAYDGNGNTGGTAPGTQTGNYNSTLTVSTAGTLTRTGYTFSGWNTLPGGGGTAYAAGASFTVPASNTTLYAQWTINSYSVTYNGNGNSGGTAPSTQTSNYNTTITISGSGTLVKTGYTFSGWNTLAGGGGTAYAAGASFTVPASNTTLYAQWAINSYNVIYDGNGSDGGSSPVTQTANYNSSVTVSGIGSLTKSGYTFTGWNTATDGSGSSFAAGASYTIPTANTTFYAQWTCALTTVPTATAATSIASSSFTANWNAVSGATSYYVDVYTNTSVNEDFSDGDFTSTPAWVGNTSNYAVLTAATLPSGTATTDGSYLGSNASVTNSAVCMPASETSKWEFSLGSPNFQPSSTNFFGVILMSNNAVSGDVTTASFNGYYLKIGVNSSPDPIELWKSAGTTKTKIGDFPSSQDYNSNALQSGLDIMVTRSSSGQFQLYYATGFTYSSAPSTSAGTLTDNTYSTSSYFGVYTNFSNPAATRRVYIDNIKFGTVTYVSGFQNYSTSNTNATITGLSTNTTYYYVVRASNGNCSTSSSNEISATTTTCNPTHTITSFIPTSGPTGTLVTITGTSFTGATAVSFGGINATGFSVVNNTTITAEVPSSLAATSQIAVTVGGCSVSSSTNFSYLSQSGTCSGTMSDLIISEIYDPASGNNHYIEIYNGTANAVTLNNSSNPYEVEIQNNPSGTLTSISLTGTINAGGILVIYAGTNGGLATSPAQGLGSGFNEDDQIRLYKNGVIIDRVIAPSNVGYDYQRLNTVTGPNATYTAAEWTIVDDGTETNANIGGYTPGTSFSITSHPADVTACSFLMQVTASQSGATYQWKYNDGKSMTGWTNVTKTNLVATNAGNANVTVSTSTSGNTNTLTITGDVSYLLNYQFYCEVTRTGCTKNSNAAQFTYSTLPVYRSRSVVTNGDWTTAANWEMAATTSGPWFTTCAYPVSLNSSEVIIQSGTGIYLSSDVDIDKVTIESTGTLELTTTGKLMVYDSTATSDFMVDGTLYDRASSGNGISFSGGSTWTLGSAGTVIKTNNSSAAAFRTNYYNGISNIPATASWIYRYNADGNPSNVAVDMYYPNLYFENTTGSLYSFNSSFTAFAGASGYSTVKGNMFVGTTGSGPVTVYNSNINAQPMLLMGNLSIGTGSSLISSSYDGASNSTHGYGTGIELRGNLTNAGNFTTTYNAANTGSGQLWFTGNTNQIVSGAGAFNLYDATVNNGSGGSVTLNTDLLVPHNLSFVNGIVNTAASPNGLLTLGFATNAVLGSPGTSSYVNGPMAKQFAVGATTEFLYPIGKSAATPAYNPCSVLPVSTTGSTTTYTSEYFAGPHQNYAVMGLNLMGITNTNYWDISKSGGNAGNSARVKLTYTNPGSGNWIYYNSSGPGAYYNTALDPCSACNVAVVHRETASNTWNFTASPASFNSSLPEYRFYTNNGDIYSAPVSSFSPFSVGYAFNIILPVNLLSFTGRLVFTDGRLDWKLADAKDLEGFDLEYSRDGRSYRKLATIKSNGGTAYSYLHTNLPAGAHYYRLLVKDKNGKTFYSQVVLLRLGELHTYLVGLTPTVVSSQLLPVVFSAREQPVEALITDVLGRRIGSEKSLLQAGTNQLRISAQSLARGMYFISLFTPDGLKETRKFIKE